MRRANTQNSAPPNPGVRVMVTGGAGYVGSVLVRRLLRAGCRVRVLDRFFFGAGPLSSLRSARLELVRGDIRWFDKRLLRGVDAVVDMASISNDPAGRLDPAATDQINHRGRARVARLARQMGVGRYVLASSCSVYGSSGEVCGEGSPARPLTAYARANLDAERAAERLAAGGFSTVSLRFATVFGLSARMRFDLAVNAMALGLWRDGKMSVMRDGRQWRPLVHVRDAARAYMHFIRSREGGVFNVGSENWQVRPLSEEVARAAGMRPRRRWYGGADARSYRASFARAEGAGFRARRSVADGVREVIGALEAGRTVDSPRTRTVEWYSRLLEAEKTFREAELGGRVL